MDKLIIYLEKIKKVHKIKEGGNYIIEISENISEYDIDRLSIMIESKFNVNCLVINENIKLVEKKD